MPDADDGKLRCPTCGAVQESSAECRRCRCDLSLVVDAISLRRSAHTETLQYLREARYSEALHAAREAWSISADAASARLVVVCCLLAGRYREALSAWDLAAHSKRIET